ncbi:MAG: endonuclease/exonuclease/phosphatase family protein [Tannerellaceae bacterium]|nr:endonuclease/exonuclease/phosphatase family protein [Tannerellaceae bacterium]
MKRVLIILLACWAVGACTCPEQTKMRIATYNLRMDTPHDSINSWSYRKDRVKALIRYHDFDIIGTQEGFLHQLADICEIPDYTYFGAGRDDGKSAGEHAAIIYKKDKFALLDSGNYWLSETPDKPGLGWDATCCNRICSWVKFKHKDTGTEFYFFNVHFDHQGVIARKESGKLMVRKIQEIAGDAHVVCTGDFNSLPETEQIQALSALLHDSRKAAITPYGPEGTFNSRFANPITKQRIDYIFVSDRFQVDRYAVLTDNNGQYYPSDHQPVVVDLQIKEK